ncbi:hypothetical protein HMPREF3227_00944 [Corynebacterium sp. CMW7794]|nr:hypothetical protein HMPREF3227_00944 [Corynebacterium sp. CMW7794]
MLNVLLGRWATLIDSELFFGHSCGQRRNAPYATPHRRRTGVNEITKDIP